MNTIDVSNVSKVYQLGEHLDPKQTFREVLANSLRGFSSTSFHRSPNNTWNKRARTSARKWALQDISFCVQAGEVVGLIGPNGAGKSTLLKVLSRITDPSAGRIELQGRVGSLLEVGSGFHPELTGRENTYLYGAILGMTRAEITSRFDEIVNFAGVEESIDTPVKRYSSGMYVRLAFAVAAFLRTDILFIDEVLAVGDLSFQRRCLGAVKDISNSGRTVIFVSHNMSTIQSLCQRVLLIDHGKRIYDGNAESAIQQYVHSQDVSQQQRRSIRDLSHVENDFRFVDCRLSVKDSPQVSTLSTGESMSIDFEYIKKQPSPRLEILLSIYTELGAPVCNISTRLTNRHAKTTSTAFKHTPSVFETPSSKTPRGRVLAYSVLPTGGQSCHGLSCTIDRLPLLPGRYRVNIMAKDGMESLQHVTDAIIFDVVSGDYYGSGVLPEMGSVAIDHEWHGLTQHRQAGI